jgi:hypothetical protein
VTVAAFNQPVQLLHWKFNPTRLAAVGETMRQRGSPRIRATFHDGRWFAHEGCHRLRACLASGVAPTLVSTRWRKTRAALDRAHRGRAVLMFPAVKIEASG